jgi:hypothetical protein
MKAGRSRTARANEGGEPVTFGTFEAPPPPPRSRPLPPPKGR